MRLDGSLAAPVLLALLLVSCSGTQKTEPAPDAAAPRIANADEQILIQDPLERNYDPHVIMKRAESFFEKEDFAEAAVEYQHFLDLHKAHVLAPYAQYRLGLSHYKQVTARDRDSEPVRLTLNAMETLLREYPGSAYEHDARSTIKECQEHLAAYEVYVGRHYYRQAAYLAALRRFEGVLTQYPGAEASAEARYYLALTYRDLGDTDQAVEHLTGLIEQFPKNTMSTVTKESLALLAKLNGTSANGLNGTGLNGTAILPQAGVNGSGPPNIPTPTITCRLNVLC